MSACCWLLHVAGIKQPLRCLLFCCWQLDDTKHNYRWFDNFNSSYNWCDNNRTDFFFCFNLFYFSKLLLFGALELEFWVEQNLQRYSFSSEALLKPISLYSVPKTRFSSAQLTELWDCTLVLQKRGIPFNWWMWTRILWVCLSFQCQAIQRGMGTEGTMWMHSESGLAEGLIGSWSTILIYIASRTQTNVRNP